MPLARLRRRLLYAFAVLLVTGIALDGAALILSARTAAGVRADFCDYATGVYRATLSLPQAPGRIAAEQNDLKLMRQLGCPRKGAR